MKRWKKWIRSEMDMEFFACVHWVSLLWCYSMIRWFCGRDGVSFLIMTEMGITSYLMSISQRVVFCNDKVCKKLHSVVKNILWVLIPALLMIAAQFLLGWFEELPLIAGLIFDIILIVFLTLVEVFIQKFYEDDTKVLNELLAKYHENRKTED